MATMGSVMSGSAAVVVATGRDPAAFPFRCELSLAPLITFWTQLSAYHEFGRGPIPGLVREKARAARKQAVGLLAADHIDRGAIETLRAEQIQLAEQASKRFTQALADVAEVLTPAQRKQIAERMESFGRGWRHG